jgi:hypothetical protein
MKYKLLQLYLISRVIGLEMMKGIIIKKENERIEGDPNLISRS